LKSTARKQQGSSKEAAETLGLTPETLSRWRQDGGKMFILEQS